MTLATTCAVISNHVTRLTLQHGSRADSFVQDAFNHLLVTVFTFDTRFVSTNVNSCHYHHPTLGTERNTQHALNSTNLFRGLSSLLATMRPGDVVRH